MSYEQRFVGGFVFANLHAFQAALDGFAARWSDEVVLDLTAFSFTGDRTSPIELRLDYECSAAASMHDETLLALSKLGEHAASGEIDATLWIDGPSTRSVGAGGVTTLPPRHHRWDVFLAAWLGDAEWLLELGRDGVALEQHFPACRGYTTLHVAVSRPGAVAAVDALLVAGLSPSVMTAAGSPVLAFAADDEITARLLAAGADPSANDGVAFVHAVNRQRDATAKALLKAGVKLSSRRYAQLLGGLARNGRHEQFEWLLGHPDMPNLLSAPGAVASVLRVGDPALLDVMVREGAPMPETLLTDAIAVGATALVERLLKEPGAIARCGPSNRRTDAMCVAAFHAHLQLLEMLANAGVPIHPAVAGETTPLHEAAMSEGLFPIDCMTWLVEQGAPVTARDAGGRTPLQAAGDAGRDEAVEWLTARATTDRHSG